MAFDVPSLDKWHLRFLRLAVEVASWSKDPSTQVGCVIADQSRRVVSLGFNGLPSGLRDTAERLHNRELKLSLTLHAEENALLFAARSVRGCTAFVTRHPCASCAAKLIQSRIGAVVYLTHPDFDTRWAGNLVIAADAFAEAGIPVTAVSHETLRSLTP